MKSDTNTTSETVERALFWRLFNFAYRRGLIDCAISNRKNFLSRARRALKRNLAAPGDCAGDPALLIGLSLAEAEIGRGAGWIPVVQKLGCEIAEGSAK